MNAWTKIEKALKEGDGFAKKLDASDVVFDDAFEALREIRRAAEQLVEHLGAAYQMLEDEAGTAAFLKRCDAAFGNWNTLTMDAS